MVALKNEQRLGLADFSNRLPAIPHHGFLHRWIQFIQFFRAGPANGVVLLVGEFDLAVLGASPVDHADVFVGFVDAVDVEEPWGDEGAAAGFGRGRAFAEEFDVEAAFFLGFAERGLFGVFVKFDMTAQGEPLVELLVVDQEDLAFVGYEDGDGEIDFVVDVRHGEGMQEMSNDEIPKHPRKSE